MATRTHMAMVLVSLLLLAGAFREATATEFIVGGKSGWTIPASVNGLDYTSWANTTNFVIGDSLVFKYDPKFHSVLSVTGSAFATCDTSEILEAWTDGNTKVTFEKAGRLWFICGAPNHCSKGQAFKVTVSAAPAAGPQRPPATAPQSGAGNASIKASKAVVILISIIVGICLP